MTSGKDKSTSTKNAKFGRAQARGFQESRYNLTFSNLNYDSLGQRLQEKSALKSTSSSPEVVSTGWDR